MANKFYFVLPESIEIGLDYFPFPCGASPRCHAFSSVANIDYCSVLLDNPTVISSKDDIAKQIRIGTPRHPFIKAAGCDPRLPFD
jgi:hypothetical protein